MQSIIEASSTPSSHHEPNDARESPGRSPLPFNPGAGNAALQAKRAEWANLNLRQNYADEAFMRGHLRLAGLVVASSAEPATVPRLRSLLRRVGITCEDARANVGCDLKTFLDKNSDMPLWAALALTLEATGRFLPAQGV